MRSILTAACPLIWSATVLAQSCGWEPFGISDVQRGIDGRVNAVTVFDDGSGASVYFGGGLAIATPAGQEPAGIVRWGDAGWEPVGPPALAANALAVFDSGPPYPGPTLHAGTSTGVWQVAGPSAYRLGPLFEPDHLAVHAEGGVPRLYAGGSFTTIGNVQVNGIAMWNGQEWEAVGGGIAGGQARIDAMLSHDDGSGPALYITGDFITAGGPGGITVNGMARWRNSAWESMSQGLGGEPRPSVRALAVGPEGDLYAGGIFRIGTQFALHNIARWDGSQWNALGSGIPQSVSALATFDGAMHAATRGSRRQILRWNGSAWDIVATYGDGGNTWTTFPDIRAMTTHDDGTGEALYLGGEFGFITDTVVANAARLQSGTAPAIESRDGSTAVIRGLEVLDAGDGPALYIFGRFNTIGSAEANGIARRRGGQWEGLGEGVPGLVYALEAGQLAGSSERVLVASGVFDHAGSAPARNIAQWSASSGWSEVGGGLSLWASNVIPYGVTVLRFHDDGTGTQLYVGGRFAGDPGEPRYLARWDGSQWDDIGGAVPPSQSFTFVASTMASFGGNLYVGGWFSQIAGVPARNIARWEGTNWSPLGTGTNATTNQLLVQDVGTGPMLFARGSFQTAGGVESRNIAAWDGSTWHGLDGGATGMLMGIAPGAPGDAGLYALGSQTVQGHDVARWNGQGGGAWEGIPVDLDIDWRYLLLRSAWFDDGDGMALYTAGGLLGVNGTPSRQMIRWLPCPPCYADCDDNGTLNIDDFLCFIDAFAQSDPYADCDDNGLFNIDDFLCFINLFAQGCT